MSEFLGPESYEVEYVSSGFTELKVPGTSAMEQHPTALFRVLPEGVSDAAKEGTSVHVRPEFVFSDNAYQLGSVLMVAVAGKNEYVPSSVPEWRPIVPPLSLEVEDGKPSDQRTLEIIRTVAAHMIATHVAISEINSRR